jgi:hypothetical protein
MAGPVTPAVAGTAAAILVVAGTAVVTEAVVPASSNGLFLIRVDPRRMESFKEDGGE